MQTKAIYPVFLLFAFTLNTHAVDNKNVHSRIEEVTVFFQGAELVHTADAILSKGNNEVWIEGLSPNIDQNSIRIRTSNSAVVSSFEFSVDYLAEQSLSAHARKIQDAVKEQQKLLEQISTGIRINTSLLGILQKSVDKNASGAATGLSIDELVKTMEYYRTKAGELEQALSADRERESEGRKRLQELNAQFEQESLKNNKTSGMLKLNLSSPVDGNCRFTIGYYTPSAGWTPYYDINVAATDRPVKITAKAKVRQVTGIDWEKVKITLSTAVPSSGKVAPLFQTWFLQYRENNVYARGAKTVDQMETVQNSYSYDMKQVVSEEIAVSPEPAQGMPLYIVDGVPVDASYFASIDRSMIKDVQHLSASQATGIYGPAAANDVIVVTMKNTMDDYVIRSENQLNLSFRIDLPYSVPGNGKEQGIELKNQEIAATFKYYCVPKLDAETYLLAEIADWEKLDLLSGKANITYDGTYVGETYIDAASTHQNLTLTLGTDKRVAVKREKMKEYNSAGFIGNDTKREFAYLMTVRNNRNDSIRMVLKDQYPVSTLKEVVVELSKETTRPSVNKEDAGVVTWEYDMQPGESRTFKLVYAVKYPKNRTLNL